MYGGGNERRSLRLASTANVSGTRKSGGNHLVNNYHHVSLVMPQGHAPFRKSLRGHVRTVSGNKVGYNAKTFNVESVICRQLQGVRLPVPHRDSAPGPPGARCGPLLWYHICMWPYPSNKTWNLGILACCQAGCCDSWPAWEAWRT